MAGELVHGSAGTTLTQAEFEAVGLHVCNSQATGDLIYASSSTQLSRLGITNDRILISSGNSPAWSATLPAFTLGGTLNCSTQNVDVGSSSASGVLRGAIEAASTGTTWEWQTRNAINSYATRFRITGGVDIALVSWFNLTQTGINATSQIAVAGTKVIGARVVDARCDDAINSGDATTDGVIDSLRDAMITHGLIAAA